VKFLFIRGLCCGFWTLVFVPNAWITSGIVSNVGCCVVCCCAVPLAPSVWPSIVSSEAAGILCDCLWGIDILLYKVF
jgi:hypothetical protein